MKKSLLFLCFISLSLSLSPQNRKGVFRIDEACDKHELYVSFYSDDFIHTKDFNETAKNISGFQDLAQQYAIVLERGITISDEKLAEFSTTASKKSRSSASIFKLKKIFKVKVPNPTNEILLELAEKLEALDAVEYASLASSRPAEPPYDILPVTPNYEYLQNYLEPDPGVDMRYAWSLGLHGEGIRVRDVEYGVNVDHEVLNDKNVSITPNLEYDYDVIIERSDHGTAVFGIVMGDSAKYGCTGMAHGAAEMVLFPEIQVDGWNRVLAVQKSIESSSEGDVILFEMQIWGYNDQYVPAEYDAIIWDLTKAAADAGIIIVAAAGNGAENLDDPFYAEYMNRGNSGAIIVGAGEPNVSHRPTYFTTYGSRVDVQGWGWDVFSSGYGDAYMIGGDFNQTYTMFSGTSSATPVVASCVIVLQSYYHNLTGEYMSGEDMKTLLKETGTAQQGDLGKPIGPLPNMKAALEKLSSLENCRPPRGFSVAVDEDCLAKIEWTAPEDVENPKYNLYKNEEIILSETTNLSYEEALEHYETFRWAVETVCPNGETSYRLTQENDPCILPCEPATNLQHEIFTQDADCYITMTWENGTPGYEVSYRIFKDSELLETIAETTYTAVMDRNKSHEWCVQSLCGPEISDYACFITAPCVVGIEALDGDKLFELFPNPAKDQITIKYNVENLAQVELLDMNAKTLYRSEFDGDEMTISLENIPNGLYLIKITEQGRVITKKVVKQ